jgi:hypothetical protein
MRHVKDPSFLPLYDSLSSETRGLADKQFALLKQNPKHPSLRFKCIRGDLWSVRVGRSHRALAVKRILFSGSGSARTRSMIG